MYLLLILMFMYCFLLEVNQKLSDFRFPILNAKSIFRTFVRQLMEVDLTVRQSPCSHWNFSLCYEIPCVFISMVLGRQYWTSAVFFLKSTIHSRQTTLVWHGLYFLFDIGFFHATSVVVLRIYRRPRSGNWPMKIPHFGGVSRAR